MRIDIVFGTAQIGGAETQAIRLAQEFKANGHNPRLVFSRGHGPLLKVAEKHQIPWVSVSSHPRRPTSTVASRVGSEASRARDLLTFHVDRESAPDVVHAMTSANVILAHALWGYRTKRVPLVAGILGRWVTNGWRAKTLKSALNSSRSIICNAPHLATEVTERYHQDSRKVHVIPNGVEIPKWAARPADEPPRGVMVANFFPDKGHDVLLDALALLDDPPKIRLCGVGAARVAMQQKAAQLGLASVVTFIDPPADVPAELLAAQFGVHSSRSEGLSNAILEQVAAGLPVIAADVGGNPVLVEDGVNGILFPDGDSAALARAITRITADPHLRTRMGADGRERAARFSWSRCADAHLEVYEQAIRG